LATILAISLGGLCIPALSKDEFFLRPAPFFFPPREAAPLETPAEVLDRRSALRFTDQDGVAQLDANPLFSHNIVYDLFFGAWTCAKIDLEHLAVSEKHIGL
jgi:hypothetical protein